MDMIWRLAVFIGGAIGGALSRLFADELKAWTPRITSILLRRAISRLPENQKERFQEEWASHLADMPGELGKVVAATSFQVASFRIASSCRSLGRSQARYMRALQSLQLEGAITNDEWYLLHYLRLEYAGAIDLVFRRGALWYLRTLLRSWLRRQRGRRKCMRVIEYAIKSTTQGDFFGAQRLLNGAKWAMDTDCVIAPDPEVYRAYSEALAQLQLQTRA